MSFKSHTPAKPQEIESDDLMCSVPGCMSRWSVKINGAHGKCSKHAWERPDEPQYTYPAAAMTAFDAVKDYKG